MIAQFVMIDWETPMLLSPVRRDWLAEQSLGDLCDRSHLPKGHRRFVKVLMRDQELGYRKNVGSVAVDGKKISANARKHAAVSYKRAVELIQ